MKKPLECQHDFSLLIRLCHGSNFSVKLYDKLKCKQYLKEDYSENV